MKIEAKRNMYRIVIKKENGKPEGYWSGPNLFCGIHDDHFDEFGNAIIYQTYEEAQKVVDELVAKDYIKTEFKDVFVNKQIEKLKCEFYDNIIKKHYNIPAEVTGYTWNEIEDSMIKYLEKAFDSYNYVIDCESTPFIDNYFNIDDLVNYLQKLQSEGKGNYRLAINTYGDKISPNVLITNDDKKEIIINFSNESGMEVN